MIAAKAVNSLLFHPQRTPQNGSIQTDTIPVCVGVSVQGTCNYRVSIALWPGVPVRRTPLPLNRVVTKTQDFLFSQSSS